MIGCTRDQALERFLQKPKKPIRISSFIFDMIWYACSQMVKVPRILSWILRIERLFSIIYHLLTESEVTDYREILDQGLNVITRVSQGGGGGGPCSLVPYHFFPMFPCSRSFSLFVPYNILVYHIPTTLNSRAPLKN